MTSIAAVSVRSTPAARADAPPRRPWRPAVNHRSLGLAACVLGTLLAAPVARADCVDGVREATPAELEFAARAQAALAAALPAPTVDSERRGAPHDFASRPRPTLCKGQREGDFSVGVQASYLYRFTQAQADRMHAQRKLVEQQIEEIERLPPEKEAQRRQLLDQMRAAYDSAPRRNRKDPPLTPEQQAQADRAAAEGRRLEDAAHRVAAEHRAGVKPQTDPLRAQARRLEPFPQDITVRIDLNRELPAEAAAQQLSFGAASPRRSAGLKVHNVSFAVTGPEGAARQAFFEAVDRAYLKTLVGQPLPDVAASRARAAQTAAAAPVAATPEPLPAAAAAAVPGATVTQPAATTARPTAAATATERAPAARDEPKKAEPAPSTPTVQDAAKAVGKLRGLFGR